MISPDGDTFFPFILDPDSPDDDATTGLNQRDNIEQILVVDPAAGEWTLQVDGSDIPEGPQTFSVVANVPLQTGLITIFGQVTNAETGEPVENATVSRVGTDYPVSVDEFGNYSMFVLGEDEFRCEHAINRTPKTTTITPNFWDMMNEPLSVSFYLKHN